MVQEDKISIIELEQKLKQRLLLIPNLNAIYIGKTQNLDSAEYRHNENYDKTTPIAIGTPTTISKAENHLIKSLKCYFNDVEVKNINAGSAGNVDANMLYVCLNFSPKTIDELYDDELFDKPFTLKDN